MNQNPLEIYDVDAMRSLAELVPGSRYVGLRFEAWVRRGQAEVIKTKKSQGYDCWTRSHLGAEPSLVAFDVIKADAVSFLWTGVVLQEATQ